jgi:hypothetical protein
MYIVVTTCNIVSLAFLLHAIQILPDISMHFYPYDTTHRSCNLSKFTVTLQ